MVFTSSLLPFVQFPNDVVKENNTDPEGQSLNLCANSMSISKLNLLLLGREDTAKVY